MKFNEIVKSKNFRRGIEFTVAILAMLVMFGAGVFVGLEKAQFSYNWGENYYRAIAGPKPFSADVGYLNAHGAAGKILTISPTGIVLADNDNDEKNILINNQTLIKSGPLDYSVDRLKTGDYIVVIGSPDSQGEIQAQLIRVLPAPPPNH